MKKSFVNQFAKGHYKTAEYIVAHAKWQRSRGRNPSEGYKDKVNAREALALALDDLNRYEPMAGESVSYTANSLVRIVNLTGNRSTAYFNDIRLTANPGSTADDIVGFYHDESERRYREYHKSPAGKSAAQEKKIVGWPPRPSWINS